MEIQPGLFKIGEVEEVHLSGTYDLKLVFNKEIIGNEVDGNIILQEIYDVGNVLYKTETENIDELIDLLIKYTYDPCTNVDLDFSVKERIIMASGTICPSKNILFSYKGKIFIAFGRYIYGYNYYGTETLKRVSTDKVEECDHSSDEDEYDNESPSDSEDEYDNESACDSFEEYYRMINEYKDKVKPDLISNNKIYLNGPRQEQRRFSRTSDYYYSFMIYDQKTLTMDAFGLYL